MKFIPDQDISEHQVPFLDEAKTTNGWHGQGTSITSDKLKKQIIEELSYLGAIVKKWLPGTFVDHDHKRPGVLIEYQISNKNGVIFDGRIKVAGLPWKAPYGGKKYTSGYEAADKKREKESYAMALFNVRDALRSMRILQDLSPGYAALIPFMLAPGNEDNEESDLTLSEMWNIGSSSLPTPALAAPSEDGPVVEGSFTISED